MRLIIILIFLLFFCFNIKAQESVTYKNGIKHINHIINLIKKDNAVALAELINYPLRMPNPIPDIKTKKEFIANYPMLFDKKYKEELISTHFNKTNTMDMYTGFGIFRGDIWLEDDGKIATINHESPEEKALVVKLTKEEQKKMPRSVQPWESNIIVCETPKFLVRIDMMRNKDLRYISWSKPKTIADEPDLTLFNGEQEFQGTMGGVIYTFKNNEWSYAIDEVNMAETDDQVGVFLSIIQNDSVIAYYRCNVIK